MLMYAIYIYIYIICMYVCMHATFLCTIVQISYCVCSSRSDELATSLNPTSNTKNVQINSHMLSCTTLNISFTLLANVLILVGRTVSKTKGAVGKICTWKAPFSYIDSLLAKEKDLIMRQNTVRKMNTKEDRPPSSFNIHLSEMFISPFYTGNGEPYR